MDAKTVGCTILKLRKKCNMTQQTLAEKLDVSDKTVSKWENGQGYPDITIFPKLAALFGVTVDYLLLGEKKRICIAGNIIADIVKNIDSYPNSGMMARIGDINYAVGGCVPNTAINLSKIDGSLPISVFGRVGIDEYGRHILYNLQQSGIDVSGIKMSKDSPTSFCDVMSMPTGERTFFHKKGANAEFSPEDIDVKKLECDIFHIGYILLLDKFDAYDEEYKTVMARFLHSLQEKGIKTSIDVVSDNEADYAAKIIPSLKYCDFAIMNEIECCRIWNLSAFNDDGSLNVSNVKTAIRKTADCGVKNRVIIHSKKISFVMNVESGEITELTSLNIPQSEIKGSVGAGDAFCAGCLYGIYNDFSDSQLLEFASATAACSLFAVNSVDGMKSRYEIQKIAQKYGRL